ncbi:sensor histidine kinase [Polaribacter vadi]|uniref:sensor histidine kinase n=1 Tax=Polaribacter vadi TaxID=1774273 RepID=UPI0030EE4D58|tara:strand:- start:8681 stop:9430 length:750 start_codon:yes stop_codon:yes gene_type:complete
MDKTNTEIIIIIFTIIILFVTIGIVLLFTIFQKRKNELLKQQKLAKEEFEKEIAETQIEIREETLRNISWELHDNIGQLLTLAKIQLQNTTKENVKEVSETITKGLNEVRALSKLINPEAINNINLKEAVQLEVDRFNRLEFIKSSLTITGSDIDIDKKATIIIFRILQEFFSNTIKHSKASELSVCLSYTESHLKILAKDNGVGFLSEEKKEGIGLINIKNRAKLIGANALFTSEKNKGTTLEINYKL